MSAWLVFAHLLGVIVWLGGMFFVLMCLRPALGDLQPQQRAPLMLAVFERFFAWVGAAVVLIWASGLARMAQLGMGSSLPGWHAMMLTGAIMTIIFVLIRYVHFVRVRDQVARADLPAAAGSLEKIRRLVVINLVLGLITVGFAKFPGMGMF